MQALSQLGVCSFRVLGRIQGCDLVAEALGLGGEFVDPLLELGHRLGLQSLGDVALCLGRLALEDRDLGAVQGLSQPLPLLRSGGAASAAASAGGEQENRNRGKAEKSTSHGGQP